MIFLGKKGSASTDPKDIESFLSRGLENVLPSKEAFAKVLGSGKKISIYLGIDPTGPTLHMGHAIPLMKLGALQKMGHKVILLIGDFTAMIGDPSDKMAARKQLTRKEVLANCAMYKKQASKFLSFSGANAAELKFNSKWLSKLSFGDVVELASHTTVQQMLERDMFQARLSEKKPIFLHEFLYPLMQGYDSVAMDVDAEIGGNDQTFNMLAGRNLLRTLKNKEKFVIATKLLADPTGKKMGKSEGNMITLMDSAQDMFGKVMSWPDGMIIPGFELCTEMSESEIEAQKIFLAKGGNPRDAKVILAYSVAKFYHGELKATEARNAFRAAFATPSGKSIPAGAPEIQVVKGRPLVDILLENKVLSSKTEFRRFVADRAIKELTNAVVIEDPNNTVEADIDLKIGSHRFIKIRIK